ncbi:nuclear pore complex protein NUP54-like isoform X1 [Chenopodium quinoa]|uniref:nuclear pore complex protein NUP54-like isoform X1 n=1 Tax=Chenopodium quinoa TaxID=63459 RepID=UPI000B777454|nr:nuclear pore complex protein NUP54-like isoform X1 [Chenopodium quinoa]
MFGASSSGFGTPSSTPAFGAPSSTPAFGTPSSTPAFGAPSSTPAFGTPSSTPAFGTPSSTPAFGATPSTPGFGTPSSPFLGSSLFNTPSPFGQNTQQQQQTTPFSQQNTGFGFNSTPFQTPQQQQQQPQQTTPFTLSGAQQLTTQMAPVAPLPFSLAERDIQTIVDAYKDEPGNSKYAFKHLLFSVTDPKFRVKPSGVSDIMWAEAMGKLEGMDSTNRERLWPQLVKGFKDLSSRLKVSNVLILYGRMGCTTSLSILFGFYLQDEVIVADAERLRMTQGNVKTLQRHFQADTLPRIERLKQKEQGLQRRLLRVMRIVEALEGKGCRMPLMKGEVELAEKLAAIVRQLKGSGAELSRRVQNLLTVSRVQVNSNGGSISVYLPGSTKIHERSLTDMQEVLQQQTDAIARLGNVLKRDIRDMEIIMSEDTEMIGDGS